MCLSVYLFVFLSVYLYMRLRVFSFFFNKKNSIDLFLKVRCHKSIAWLYKKKCKLIYLLYHLMDHFEFYALMRVCAFSCVCTKYAPLCYWFSHPYIFINIKIHFFFLSHECVCVFFSFIIRWFNFVFLFMTTHQRFMYWISVYFFLFYYWIGL